MWRLRTFWKWFDRPTWAFPLDIFRVLVGVIGLAFFLFLLRELPDFSAPDGLIDHQLSAGLFPFTRYSLIPADASAALLQLLFAVGCLCCCALVLGYRSKLAAGVAYGILVSTYRRNFLVMYVDDSIVHLLFFWMLLFPIGRTLRLSDWFMDGTAVWQRWRNVRVPGGTIRCFVWNLALLYAVAGLWKWTSPMWRDGTAVYAVFKMPIAYQPKFWGPEHLPMLRILNYLTLVTELLFPSIALWTRGHPIKYALSLVLVGFHLIMLATLQIPFANLACIAAAVILFRDEISHWLSATVDEPIGRGAKNNTALAIAALAFTALLTATMISEAWAPEWRSPTAENGGDNHTPPILGVVGADAGIFERVHDALLKVMWSAGIAQEYQLFNWIDHRNFSLNYEVWEMEVNRPALRIESSRMFPQNIRGVLLQSYMHGVTWTSIPDDRLTILKRSLSTRLAQRYCRGYQPKGLMVVHSSLQRIDPRQPNTSNVHLRVLLSFRCSGNEAILDANL